VGFFDKRYELSLKRLIRSTVFFLCLSKAGFSPTGEMMFSESLVFCH